MLIRHGLCGLLAAAFVQVQGIRLTKRPGSIPPNPSAISGFREADVGASNASSCSVRPPGVSHFAERWNQFMEKERKDLNLKREVDHAAPKVIVGVFSKAGCEDVPYRDAIRSTWMQQPLVCNLSDFSPPASCRVYVTFVLGNNGAATGETDLTILPTEENMNCGKTWAWFRYASKRYNWAKYIVKMDMDAFPHFSSFLAGLQRHRLEHKCRNVYGGRPWRCGNKVYDCPSPSCGFPVKGDFMRYEVDDPSCYSYMQGGFYLLSRKLAKNVSRLGGWWHNQSRRCFPEDSVTGHAIQKFAARHDICVSAFLFHYRDFYWHNESAWGS